eukprot:6176524-Pleurochrysis_carterae.AAC.3
MAAACLPSTQGNGEHPWADRRSRSGGTNISECQIYKETYDVVPTTSLLECVGSYLEGRQVHAFKAQDKQRTPIQRLLTTNKKDGGCWRRTRRVS